MDIAADGSITPGSIVFEAESPDEAALVACAHVYGFVLTMRSAHNCTVNIRGTDVNYRVLAILPFDNDRKRMSVIVQLPGGTVRVLCKGADSAIFAILRDDPTTEEIAEATLGHIDMFARRGLRTLCFA